MEVYQDGQTYTLASLEAMIDMSVLRSYPANSRGPKRIRRQDKKLAFQTTVRAIHLIVSSKVYKSNNQTLEEYFLSNWKISRAQVYRLFDCGVIMRELEGFAVKPARERLCRSLKDLAKTPGDRRKLWAAVLETVGKDIDSDAITSTAVREVWKSMGAHKDGDHASRGLSQEQVSLPRHPHCPHASLGCSSMGNPGLPQSFSNTPSEASDRSSTSTDQVKRHRLSTAFRSLPEKFKKRKGLFARKGARDLGPGDACSSLADGEPAHEVEMAQVASRDTEMTELQESSDTARNGGRPFARLKPASKTVNESSNMHSDVEAQYKAAADRLLRREDGIGDLGGRATMTTRKFAENTVEPPLYGTRVHQSSPPGAWALRSPGENIHTNPLRSLPNLPHPSSTPVSSYTGAGHLYPTPEHSSPGSTVPEDRDYLSATDDLCLHPFFCGHPSVPGQSNLCQQTATPYTSLSRSNSSECRQNSPAFYYSLPRPQDVSSGYAPASGFHLSQGEFLPLVSPAAPSSCSSMEASGLPPRRATSLRTGRCPGSRRSHAHNMPLCAARSRRRSRPPELPPYCCERYTSLGATMSSSLQSPAVPCPGLRALSSSESSQVIQPALDGLGTITEDGYSFQPYMAGVSWANKISRLQLAPSLPSSASPSSPARRQLPLLNPHYRGNLTLPRVGGDPRTSLSTQPGAEQTSVECRPHRQHSRCRSPRPISGNGVRCDECSGSNPSTMSVADLVDPHLPSSVDGESPQRSSMSDIVEKQYMGPSLQDEDYRGKCSPMEVNGGVGRSPRLSGAGSPCRCLRNNQAANWGCTALPRESPPHEIESEVPSRSWYSLPRPTERPRIPSIKEVIGVATGTLEREFVAGADFMLDKSHQRTFTPHPD